MKINELLAEVKTPFIRSADQMPLRKDQEPLQDSDTIRVYHGFNEARHLITVLKQGLSGKVKANRRYSYENNNNPRGLFVTIDLATAKKFGPFIIEFHTRVTDLEAPVWPGGAFASQGQYAPSFDSDDDRRAAVQQARSDAIADPDDAISKSSKPEVANWLYNYAESQALFTGNLNPNSIRAIWASSDPNNAYAEYQRYNVKQFLQLVKQGKITDRWDTPIPTELPPDVKKKLFMPRETVTVEMLIKKLKEKYSWLDSNEIVNIIIKNPRPLLDKLWPDQYKAVMKELNTRITVP